MCLRRNWLEDAGRIQDFGPNRHLKRAYAAINRTQNKKVTPLLGPLFKEAERREVREDFVRRRFDMQNGVSEVVENNGLW
jgi:hypothetical protein